VKPTAQACHNIIVYTTPPCLVIDRRTPRETQKFPFRSWLHTSLLQTRLLPAGDPVGSAAAQRLFELSASYPERMYCPVDHYVAGPEKELLLQATDFCLLPSRFEPCGLVDVEFGWVSALRLSLAESVQLLGTRHSNLRLIQACMEHACC